ncbi:MAG: transcriptional regulator [Rhizobiales bacterium]|nr:transcriptional regulator [Hyphomicrobiales bacterium]
MEQAVNRDKDCHPEDCEPIREILARVGDKWTAVILATLGDRRMRFKDLHRAIDRISQRMLVVTLRNLERDGLMVRTVYPTVPPRVEYELSDRGRSLRQILEPVGAWVLAHQQAIEESRRCFDVDVQAKATPTLIKW